MLITPQRIYSPHIKALIDSPSAENHNNFWKRLEVAGGYFVDDKILSDGSVCDQESLVTFAVKLANKNERAAIVIDGVIDSHREDISPFEMFTEEIQVGAETVYLAHTAFHLPRQLRVAVSVHITEDFQPLVGRGRPEWLAFLSKVKPLPLASKKIPMVRGDLGGHTSLLVLPDAPNHTALEVIDNPIKGELTDFSIKSSVFGETITGWTYQPSHALNQNQEAGGLLVCFDGHRWVTKMRLYNMLERLIDAQEIPPVCAVFINTDHGIDRELILALNPSLPTFFEKELISHIKETLPIPNDPQKRIINGASYGGLASAQILYESTNFFGAAIIQSMSMHYEGTEPNGSARELVNQWLAVTPQEKAVKVFHEAGVFEGKSQGKNEIFAEEMRTKGFDWHFEPFYGGHSFINWHAGILTGLKYLLT